MKLRDGTPKIVLCKYAIIILSIIMSMDFFAVKGYGAEKVDNEVKSEVRSFIEKVITERNKAIVTNESENIKAVYDVSTKLGQWAYESEEKKMIYLHNWEQKQGVKFTEIVPMVFINRISENDNGFKVNFTCSTEYRYVYEDKPDEVNVARIGTYHVQTLINKDDKLLISKEWYTDPFADSLNLEKLKVDDGKQFILSQGPRDFSNLNEKRKRVKEYADRYCGAAGEEQYGFKYNNKSYKNFNPEGGDCANFASQTLYEGGRFKKTMAWDYNNGEATASWINADKFKNYWVYSGRASVLAYGKYEKVYKASYKLLPGDFVAYEKKGDVKHISMVTSADSKGYTLVTCHNTDRNDVPWDLGWSDKDIKFWLVRVHFPN